MPKRSRDRRTSPLAQLQQRLDKVTGGPCRAIPVPWTDHPDAPPGSLMFVLMADGCAACVANRARVWTPKPPEPGTVDDDAHVSTRPR